MKTATLILLLLLTTSCHTDDNDKDKIKIDTDQLMVIAVSMDMVAYATRDYPQSYKTNMSAASYNELRVYLTGWLDRVHRDYTNESQRITR